MALKQTTTSRPDLTPRNCALIFLHVNNSKIAGEHQATIKKVKALRGTKIERKGLHCPWHDLTNNQHGPADGAPDSAVVTWLDPSKKH